MIKALTFDLDGVYFINGKSNFIKNLVALGVNETEAKRVFLESEEMNRKYKTGQWTDQEFWTWALTEWKLNKTVSDIVDLLISGYEENKEVVGFVKNIRAKGYKTLICSNNFAARINGLQKKFGFLDNFDAVVLAYQVGSTKPDRKIFEELISKSGVQPNEILYTDDYQAALDSAGNLGIQTYFYKDFKDFTETLAKLGVK